MSKRLILVAHAEGLHNHFDGQLGFIKTPEANLISAIEAAGTWLGPRAPLEVIDRPVTFPTDRKLTPEELYSWRPSFRQVLPYIIVKCNGKVLRYARTPKGEEAKLHDMLSIGLGGHIDAPDVVWNGGDVDLVRTLTDSAWRELNEEVGLELRSLENPGPDMVTEIKWHGIILDDANEVGKVHFAVVGIVELAWLPDAFLSAEDQIGGLKQVTLEELKADHDRLEPWSQFVADYLYEQAAA